MNLVGKIFIVLIFVMSLVFMSLTVVVYATHKNWREVVMRTEASQGKELGLVHQLKQEEDETERLNKQLEDQKGTLQEEIDRKQTRLAELENKNKTLQVELNEQQKANAALKEDFRRNEATLLVTQQSCAGLQDQVTSARAENKRLLAKGETLQIQATQLTDALNAAQSEREMLKLQATNLAKVHAETLEINRRFGAPASMEAAMEFPLPGSNGVILASRPGGQLELSLGSDDGLRKGHYLEVSRGAAYLGRIVVTDTETDKSVARVIPEMNKGPMLRGDRFLAQPMPVKRAG